MLLRVLLLAVVAVVRPAEAEPWSAARIRALPDSAFAAIELDPDGRPRRHLPHHDEAGAVDVPHLRAALGRFSQVRWRDPAAAEVARRHLEEHWRALKTLR